MNQITTLIFSVIFSFLAPGSAHILFKLSRKGYFFFISYFILVVLSGYSFFSWRSLFLIVLIIELFLVFISLFDAIRLVLVNDELDFSIPTKIRIGLLAPFILIILFYISPFSRQIKRYVSYPVVNESMKPALVSGDRVMVDQWLNVDKDLEVGDILLYHPPVVFKEPDDRWLFVQTKNRSIKKGDDYFDIKRCVGLEGDRVEIQSNELLINKKIPNWPYFKEGRYKLQDYLSPFEGIGKYRLDYLHPQQLLRNQVFLIGDNWYHSYDSRVYGAQKRSSIQGKVLFIINE